MGRVKDYLRRLVGLDDSILKDYARAGIDFALADEAALRGTGAGSELVRAHERWCATEELISAAGYRTLSYEPIWNLRHDAAAVEKLQALVRPRGQGSAERHAIWYRPRYLLTEQERQLFGEHAPPGPQLSGPRETCAPFYSRTD